MYTVIASLFTTEFPFITTSVCGRIPSFCIPNHFLPSRLVSISNSDHSQWVKESGGLKDFDKTKIGLPTLTKIRTSTTNVEDCENEDIATEHLPVKYTLWCVNR